MLLPKQVISFAQLQAQGYSPKQITEMNASLKLFPTPFKGIYYVPLEEERKGNFIEKPIKALSQALSLFLKSNDFYFSCQTAKEALGLDWQASGNIHVVNNHISRTIDLRQRAQKNLAKNNWRAKKIADILSQYGNSITFHKGSTSAAKIKQTPYGKFALKPQLKADMARFREN